MGLEGTIKLSGKFHVQCFDKDGNFKWEDWAINAATNEGLNHILDVEFHGTTQVATWYIGLIKAATTGLAAGDTLASHGGWTEAVPGTDFTGDRLAWTEGAANTQSMTNAATVDFPMLNTFTIKGAILASVATGTSGILFCTAYFTGGDQAVGNGDTLKVTYTISAAAA